MRATTSYLALAVLALSGCASTSTVKQTRDPVVVTMGDGTTLRYDTDIRVAATDVDGTPETLWPRLNAALAGFGLPITVRDNAKFLVGSQNAQFSNQFNKAPLSRILDCGQSQFGPRANSYRVQLSVVSQLVPSAKGGSTVRTSVAGMAKDENSSTDPVQCASTGALEHDIADALGGN